MRSLAFALATLVLVSPSLAQSPPEVDVTVRPGGNTYRPARPASVGDRWPFPVGGVNTEKLKATPKGLTATKPDVAVARYVQYASPPTPDDRRPVEDKGGHGASCPDRCPDPDAHKRKPPDPSILPKLADLKPYLVPAAIVAVAGFVAYRARNKV